jgi:hypothetical protein
MGDIVLVDSRDGVSQTKVVVVASHKKAVVDSRTETVVVVVVASHKMVVVDSRMGMVVASQTKVDGGQVRSPDPHWMLGM